MQLSAEQIKALIAMQIEGCGRRLAELARESAALRKQPIRGSRELMQRLQYLEGEQVKQQARLDTLKDLQQHIQTLEGFTREI